MSINAHYQYLSGAQRNRIFHLLLPHMGNPEFSSLASYLSRFYGVRLNTIYAVWFDSRLHRTGQKGWIHL